MIQGETARDASGTRPERVRFFKFYRVGRVRDASGTRPQPAWSYNTPPPLFPDHQLSAPFDAPVGGAAASRSPTDPDEGQLGVRGVPPILTRASRLVWGGIGAQPTWETCLRSGRASAAVSPVAGEFPRGLCAFEQPTIPPSTGGSKRDDTVHGNVTLPRNGGRVTQSWIILMDLGRVPGPRPVGIGNRGRRRGCRCGANGESTSVTPWKQEENTKAVAPRSGLAGWCGSCEGRDAPFGASLDARPSQVGYRSLSVRRRFGRGCTPAAWAAWNAASTRLASRFAPSCASVVMLSPGCPAAAVAGSPFVRSGRPSGGSGCPCEGSGPCGLSGPPSGRSGPPRAVGPPLRAVGSPPDGRDSPPGGRPPPTGGRAALRAVGPAYGRSGPPYGHPSGAVDQSWIPKLFRPRKFPPTCPAGRSRK
eukprot:gene3186-biopygen3662